MSIDFNKEVILEVPPREVSNIGWAKPVRVSFDAAEGSGRVWLMVDAEHDKDEPWIAIEGPDNCRQLAALLLAWADAGEPAVHCTAHVDYAPETRVSAGGEVERAFAAMALLADVHNAFQGTPGHPWIPGGEATQDLQRRVAAWHAAKGGDL